jgi:hypothetical protein
MIIWHMANSPAGVSMVNSIVYCVWMNLMHSGFSMARKSVSLIIIEDSFPCVTSSGVTRSHIRKAGALEKGHQSEKAAQKVIKGAVKHARLVSTGLYYTEVLYHSL